MKLTYILCQIHRNNTGTSSTDCTCLSVKRESGCICNIISDHLRSHLQKLFVGIVGRNLREHSIDDIVDLTDLHGLCLTDKLLDHFSLTLGTLEIISCCVTNTAVGSRLYTVQSLKTCMCQRFRRYTRYLRSLYHIVIQMIDLCLININVYTAQQIKIMEAN